MEHESDMSGTDEDNEETTTNEVVPPPQERLKLDLSEDEYQNLQDYIIYIHDCKKIIALHDQSIDDLQQQIFLLLENIEKYQYKKSLVEANMQQVQDEMDQFYSTWR